MLRLLGRRRGGYPLHEDDQQRLGGWLEMLSRDRVVVVHCPEHEDGLLYVDEPLRGGPNPDIPIRVQVLRLYEVPDAEGE